MKIPTSFKLMGDTLMTHGTELSDELSDDNTNGTREQRFCRDLSHHILDRMAESELSKSIQFVTIFGNLLHQALSTAEYAPEEPSLQEQVAKALNDIDVEFSKKRQEASFQERVTNFTRDTKLKLDYDLSKLEADLNNIGGVGGPIFPTPPNENYNERPETLTASVLDDITDRVAAEITIGLDDKFSLATSKFTAGRINALIRHTLGWDKRASGYKGGRG